MAKKNSGQLFESKLESLGKGEYGDGGKLSLVKSSTGNKGKWVFRFVSPLTKKTRRMGLGSLPIVSLDEAREKARKARLLLDEQKDPLEERVRENLALQKIHGLSFEEVSERYILSMFPRWKDGKNGSTYRKHKNQLALHAFPIIGKRPIAAVDKNDILQVLEPLFEDKKGKTALELRKYLKSILDYAKAREWRSGDNPAEWRGNLNHILPDPSKISPVKHHKALESKQMPTFMKALMQSNGIAALAARFVILTATRSGEGRKALWGEINFKKNLWIIPEIRMKAGKEHIVPLSPEVVELLKTVRPLSNGNGLIFPNSKNKPLSDVALLKAVKLAGKAVGEPDLTLHGLRATFRTWVGDETNHEREVAEHALAHAVGVVSERSYARGTMIEKRRILMDDWGKFCMGES
ncbi:DUF4102 domain-containing protein [Acetobacteraceae bacterium]|nr:DUF4102 domain-containing protein [Acetobacteraceae bacterium]